MGSPPQPGATGCVEDATEKEEPGEGGLAVNPLWPEPPTGCVEDGTEKEEPGEGGLAVNPLQPEPPTGCVGDATEKEGLVERWLDDKSAVAGAAYGLLIDEKINTLYNAIVKE